MSAIVDIHAREILDSRGNPTVEVDVMLESGAFGRAAVPSGASTGQHEAVERRDGDRPLPGQGRAGRRRLGEPRDLRHPAGLRGGRSGKLDRTLIALDGTPNKDRLGANAILGVSLGGQGGGRGRGAGTLPLRRRRGRALLPTPMMNIVNGGEHADNALDFQEFMVMPVGQDSFAEALRCGAEVFHALKARLKQNGHNTNVGDEGGFAPGAQEHQRGAGFTSPGRSRTPATPRASDVVLALDCAASEFFKDGQYVLEGEGKTLDSAQFADFLAELCDSHPIVSIEDGMAEDDWDGWAALTKRIGDRVQLVGDDLFVTNTERLARACATASPTRSWSRSTRSAR